MLPVRFFLLQNSALCHRDISHRLDEYFGSVNPKCWIAGVTAAIDRYNAKGYESNDSHRIYTAYCVGNPQGGETVRTISIFNFEQMNQG
jgi:hypothetical protein